MVLKRLKLHQFLNGTNFFLHTSMGVGSRPVTRGGLNTMQNVDPLEKTCWA